VQSKSSGINCNLHRKHKQFSEFIRRITSIESPYMTNPFFQAIVSGFVFYSLIIFVIRPFISEPAKNKIEKFDHSACILIAIVGLIHLLFWTTNLIEQFNSSNNESAIYLMKTRLFGSYWFGYWFQPFLILVSQLLWSKKLRSIKWSRFVIPSVLIVSIESIMVHLTSTNRDYLPSSWSTPIGPTIISWILGFGTFMFFSAVFHFVRTRRSTKKCNLDQEV